MNGLKGFEMLKLEESLSMCRVKFSSQKDQDAAIASVSNSLSERHLVLNFAPQSPALFIIGFSMTECVIQLIHNASTFKVMVSTVKNVNSLTRRVFVFACDNKRWLDWALFFLINQWSSSLHFVTVKYSRLSIMRLHGFPRNVGWNFFIHNTTWGSLCYTI